MEHDHVEQVIPGIGSRAGKRVAASDKPLDRSWAGKLEAIVASHMLSSIF
jgi:hypothetical protein